MINLFNYNLLIIYLEIYKNYCKSINQIIVQNQINYILSVKYNIGFLNGNRSSESHLRINAIIT
jgi:hypothetical protein